MMPKRIMPLQTNRDHERRLYVIREEGARRNRRAAWVFVTDGLPPSMVARAMSYATGYRVDFTGLSKGRLCRRYADPYGSDEAPFDDQLRAAFHKELQREARAHLASTRSLYDERLAYLEQAVAADGCFVDEAWRPMDSERFKHEPQREET